MTEQKKRNVTYTVRGIFKMRAGCYVVWEHLDGAPVNQYTAYERGNEFVLYPYCKLMPSSLEMTKKTIGMREAKRAF